MASIRSVVKRVRQWMNSDDRRKGGGPGGGPNSEAFNRARGEIEMLRMHNNPPGSF